jgi:CheY-like chemotaxis protein
MERILDIYDAPGSQRTVRRILEPAGYDVITARADPNAIEVFRETNPGLVVLDLCERGKSGRDLCREIRANSDVPLLVCAVSHLADVVVLVISPRIFSCYISERVPHRDWRCFSRLGRIVVGIQSPSSRRGSGNATTRAKLSLNDLHAWMICMPG